MSFQGTDNCLGDGKTVSEYYCNGNSAAGTTHVCSTACQAGHCVSDVDSCENHNLRTTWIANQNCHEQWVDSVGYCYHCTGVTTTTNGVTTTTVCTGPNCGGGDEDNTLLYLGIGAVGLVAVMAFMKK
jgi:hypothetical protein